VTEAPARARRPRNRRQLIIAAAAEQFRAAGYHNTGITDIADAVGITSAALYRHFAGKQDLLRATVQDALERVGQAFAQAGPELEPVLRAACALPLQGPALGVLWYREMAHLPDDVQVSLRGQLVAAVEPVRKAIAEVRTDLDDDAVNLVLWATLGVVASDAYPAIRIDARRFQQRLFDTCLAVVGVALPPTPPDGTARPRPAHPTLLPASRPEAILAAASRQFGAKGYQEVGMDDIGAEAGITGATIYHHFENKAAILTACLNRCLQSMLFDLSAALDSSTSPAEALDRLLGYFVRTCIEHGHVVAALQKEAINLPDQERLTLFQAERDYRDEWVALLVGHRDELSVAEAQIAVRATITSIGSLIDVRRVVTRPGLGGELTAIGRATLGLTAPHPGPA
jgi:AcrR family transcriptional regulator